jgi:hypothetical protein
LKLLDPWTQYSPKMPASFSIYKLFFVVGDILRDDDYQFVADEHSEKMELYIDFLKRNARKPEPESYFRIVDAILEHETPDVVYKFLYYVLRTMDEWATMESIFEEKENLTDRQLLMYSNCCSDVRKFKEYITNNPLSSCD